MKKYNIPAVRIPREKINHKIVLSGVSISRLTQLIVLNFLCSKVKDKSILHTNHFAGFLYSGQLNKKRLKNLLGFIPQNGICELMCHPGLKNNDIQYNRWQYRWYDELQALTDRSVLDYIRQKGFQFISYRDLIEPVINRNKCP
jgi:predicted glycoside hydrolase/deacetylase ChbG (UPF0249 family)